MALLTRVVFRASFYVCLVSLFVPLFFPPYRPYAGIFFLFSVLFSSVQQQQLLSGAAVCSSSSTRTLFFWKSFRFSRIALFRTPVEFLVFFVLVLLFSWSGLWFLLCVLVPGTLAFLHLLFHLD